MGTVLSMRWQTSRVNTKSSAFFHPYVYCCIRYWERRGAYIISMECHWVATWDVSDGAWLVSWKVERKVGERSGDLEFSAIFSLGVKNECADQG